MSAGIYAFKRLALSLTGIFLGSVPFIVLLIGGKWMGIDVISPNGAVSELEITAVITLIFAAIAVSAGFILEYAGHLTGTREHGSEVLDGVATLFFVLVFLALFFLSSLAGAMFVIQLSSIGGESALLEMLSEAQVINDLPDFFVSVFALVCLAELWVARRVLVQRRVKDYFYE